MMAAVGLVLICLGALAVRRLTTTRRRPLADGARIRWVAGPRRGESWPSPWT